MSNVLGVEVCLSRSDSRFQLCSCGCLRLHTLELVQVTFPGSISANQLVKHIWRQLSSWGMVCTVYRSNVYSHNQQQGMHPLTGPQLVPLVQAQPVHQQHPPPSDQTELAVQCSRQQNTPVWSWKGSLPNLTKQAECRDLPRIQICCGMSAPIPKVSPRNEFAMVIGVFVPLSVLITRQAHIKRLPSLTLHARLASQTLSLFDDCKQRAYTLLPSLL